MTKAPHEKPAPPVHGTAGDDACVDWGGKPAVATGSFWDGAVYGFDGDDFFIFLPTGPEVDPAGAGDGSASDQGEGGGN